MIIKPKNILVCPKKGAIAHTIIAPIKTRIIYTGTRSERKYKRNAHSEHLIRRGGTVLMVLPQYRKGKNMADLIKFPKEELLSNFVEKAYFTYQTFKFTKR